jgi:hypothetical protein
LSTPVALFKPIDANTLARLYSEDKIALETQVGHGLKSDGSLVLSVRAVVKKKVHNKIVRSYGELFHYNVTDLVAASGSINVLQGTTPWVTLKAITVSVLLSGNPLFNIAQDILLKSCVITTSAVAGNRQLGFGGGTSIFSTKKIIASTTGDLLDREVAVAANTAVNILNVDTINGDNVYYSYVKLA